MSAEAEAHHAAYLEELAFWDEMPGLEEVSDSE